MLSCTAPKSYFRSELRLNPHSLKEFRFKKKKVFKALMISTVSVIKIINFVFFQSFVFKSKKLLV